VNATEAIIAIGIVQNIAKQLLDVHFQARRTALCTNCTD